MISLFVCICFPVDKTRCRLSAIPGMEGSDYINANYIEVMLCYSRCNAREILSPFTGWKSSIKYTFCFVHHRSTCMLACKFYF